VSSPKSLFKDIKIKFFFQESFSCFSLKEMMRNMTQRVNPTASRVRRALDRSREMCARLCLFLFRLSCTTIWSGPAAPRRARYQVESQGRRCGPSNSIATRTSHNLRTSMKVYFDDEDGQRCETNVKRNARDENVMTFSGRLPLAEKSIVERRVFFFFCRS